METINLNSCDGILTITFDRPGSLNAVDLEMARDMHCLAPRLRADHSTRVIVLRGAGNAFMAGGDIRQFAEHLDNIEPFIAEVIEGFHVFIRALADAPQPVVASIGGPAAGGGLSLALSADLAIAARGSKLAYAYRHLGTSPDGGGTYFLPRMVGAKRAAELLLLRDAIAAEEALALGLVNWVVEPDALENMTPRDRAPSGAQRARGKPCHEGAAARVHRRGLRRPTRPGAGFLPALCKPAGFQGRGDRVPGEAAARLRHRTVNSGLPKPAARTRS